MLPSRCTSRNPMSITPVMPITHFLPIALRQKRNGSGPPLLAVRIGRAPVGCGGAVTGGVVVVATFLLAPRTGSCPCELDSTLHPRTVCESCRSSQMTTEDVLRQGIDDGTHIGAQIHVKHRGDTVIDAAYGEASTGVPMTRDSMMI